MFYRVSTAVISPTLAADLRLTGVELGALAAAFFYAFAFSQIPLGMILDRLGARLTMSGLGLVAIVGALLFAAAHGNGAAVAGRVLLGVGMSCNLIGALTLIGAWFPVNRFATLSGIFVAVGILGNMAATSPLVLMARTLGWRGSFVAIALLNALQVAALLWVVRNRPASAVAPPGRREKTLQGMARLFKEYSYWAISMASFVRYGFLAALQGLWAGLFLMSGLAIDPLTTGNAILCMGLGYMLGMPVSGRMSDAWLRSRKHVVWPSLILVGGLCLVLVSWDRDTPLWVIDTVFTLFGIISATANVMFAHIRELFPPEMAARAMTGVNFFVMLGAAVFTQIIGFVVGDGLSGLDRPEAFRPAWILGACSMGAAGVLYLFTPDSKALRPPEERK
jgi:MFS family permease